MGIRNLVIKYFPLLLLIWVIITEFDIFAKVPIPLFYTASHSAFIGMNLIFLAYYIIYCINTRTISRMFFYMLPILVIPIISAWQAYSEYGQPFMLGLLSERGKYFAISGVMVVHFLERGFWTIDMIKRVMINFSYFFFGVLLFLYIMVDPALFEGTEFVLKSSYRGYRYGFNQTFVVFLFMWSLFKALIERQQRYVILLIAVLFYMFVFQQGRSLLLATLGASAIFLLRNYRITQTLRYFIGIGFAGALVLVVSYLIVPQTVETNMLLFASAFNTIFGGEVVDGSAASRITQVGVAMEGIIRHPLVGNGFLSSRWNEGFSSVYGHFFPSDIGWFGVLFLYGIVGWVFLMLPFLYAFLFRKKLVHNNDLFLVTIQAVLLYFFIHNMSAAFVVKKIGMSTFLFAIVYYYRFIAVPEPQPEEQPVATAHSQPVFNGGVYS